MAVNTRTAASVHPHTHTHWRRHHPTMRHLPLRRLSGVKLKAFSVATEGHLNCFRFAPCLLPASRTTLCFSGSVSFFSYTFHILFFFVVVFRQKIIKNAWPYIFLLLTKIALLFVYVSIELAIRSSLYQKFHFCVLYFFFGFGLLSLFFFGHCSMNAFIWLISHVCQWVFRPNIYPLYCEKHNIILLQK